MADDEATVYVRFSRAGLTEDEAREAFFRDFRTEATVVERLPVVMPCGDMWVADVLAKVDHKTYERLRRAYDHRRPQPQWENLPPWPAPDGS